MGEGAIQIFMKRAIMNDDISIYGDGNQIRAWCYVDDFVDCLMKCIENPKAIGKSFSISSSRAVVTTYGLAQTVCRVPNSKSKITFKPALSAEIELRIPFVDKADSILEFKATTMLDEGILKTTEWIKNNLL